VAERHLTVTRYEHLSDSDRVATAASVVHTNQNVIEHVISCGGEVTSNIRSVEARSIGAGPRADRGFLLDA
jgi:hypothetical protein